MPRDIYKHAMGYSELQRKVKLLPEGTLENYVPGSDETVQLPNCPVGFYAFCSGGSGSKETLAKE